MYVGQRHGGGVKKSENTCGACTAHGCLLSGLCLVIPLMLSNFQRHPFLQEATPTLTVWVPPTGRF